MKVTIINHSDSKGGASVASMRLMRALRASGVDASMLVADKSTHDPYVHLAPRKMLKKAAFLAEHLDIYLHNGFSRRRLFQASLANFGLPLASHPLVAEADIVVIGWINQGMLSLDEIAKIKAPVVWNMHDMWNFTGICHVAHGCRRYTQHCGNCPLLDIKGARGKMPDISTAIQRSKQALYLAKPITFVAVSHWLEQKGRESLLLRREDIRVIPNAFPYEEFSCHPAMSREALGLPAHKRLIAMGAARLDDGVKGLELAIEAFNKIGRDDVAAVLFGNIRNPRLLDSISIPWVHLGPVADKAALSSIYAHSAAVLSSSHCESFGYTLLEGMSCGAVPVTFGQGGQTDIVDHLRTGYVAQYPSTDDLADGLRWALDSNIAREALHKEAAEKFGGEAVARQYIDLFNQILTK